MKKKIVVFTGAGVSADSGIATFRDSDGLWANYRIEDVCTAEALENNRPTVIDFYNQRRRELLEKKPNPAHYALASLEEKYEVVLITQNVDDLHERAGSSRVLHLHGELSCLRSSADPEAVFPIPGWKEAAEAMRDGADIDSFEKVWKEELDARAPDGSLLRPHVVFFGEQVPNYDRACRLAATAQLFIVCGTSLAVYPAAALLFSVPAGVPVYLVDPKRPENVSLRNNPFTFIQKKAAEGMPELCRQLLQEER